MIKIHFSIEHMHGFSIIHYAVGYAEQIAVTVLQSPITAAILQPITAAILDQILKNSSIPISDNASHI
jgi:hypothetical protein